MGTRHRKAPKISDKADFRYRMALELQTIRKRLMEVTSLAGYALDLLEGADLSKGVPPVSFAISDLNEKVAIANIANQRLLAHQQVVTGNLFNPKDMTPEGFAILQSMVTGKNIGKK